MPIWRIFPHNRTLERPLAESLSHGIGYYHKALSKNDTRIVEERFEGGAFKILLASRCVAWELSTTAHMVIVMGTQFFEERGIAILVALSGGVLQMLRKPSKPGENKFGKALLMTTAVKRDYQLEFLDEALPIESHFPAYLYSSFVTEIGTKTIRNSGYR